MTSSACSKRFDQEGEYNYTSGKVLAGSSFAFGGRIVVKKRTQPLNAQIVVTVNGNTNYSLVLLFISNRFRCFAVDSINI